MTDTAHVRTPVRYVYDFQKLDRVPDGVLSARVSPRRMLSGDTATTGKSLTIGAVVVGKSLQVSIADNARGTGSKLHTHPNEQFNFVLQGTLIADIDGQVLRVPAGHFIHIPAGMVHSHVSSPEEDVVFVAAKDTRHGITGPPVDGKHDGPRTLPGFGANTNNEWKMGADGLPEAQSPRVNATDVKYVYDLERDSASPVSKSGELTPRSTLDTIPLASGTTIGGEKLSVGTVRVAPGPAAKPGRSDRERFLVVLDGSLRAEVDGQAVTVPPRSGLHIPAGTLHSIAAVGDADSLCILVEGDGNPK